MHTVPSPVRAQGTVPHFLTSAAQGPIHSFSAGSPGLSCPHGGLFSAFLELASSPGCTRSSLEALGCGLTEAEAQGTTSPGSRTDPLPWGLGGWGGQPCLATCQVPSSVPA